MVKNVTVTLADLRQCTQAWQKKPGRQKATAYAMHKLRLLQYKDERIGAKNKDN